MTLISQIQLGNNVASVPGLNLVLETNLYDISNEPAMYTQYCPMALPKWLPLTSNAHIIIESETWMQLPMLNPQSGMQGLYRKLYIPYQQMIVKTLLNKELGIPI